MATSGPAPINVEMAVPAHKAAQASAPPRHTAFVRMSHWIFALCFFALVLSGTEILISHPRFYWGETGNVNTQPLFKIPIPSSRKLVPTGYGYTLPDQNGWSRAMHFEAAWFAVITGLFYLAYGVFTRHFKNSIAPRKEHLSPRGLWTSFMKPLRWQRPGPEEAASYNGLQRIAYIVVIFILFPLEIWSGLALSLGFISAFPLTVELLGGRQSARTIHFFDSIALLLFLVVHIVMICLAGFRGRTTAMITGRATAQKERA